jgi:hypothetical protein
VQFEPNAAASYRNFVEFGLGWTQTVELSGSLRDRATRAFFWGSIVRQQCISFDYGAQRRPRCDAWRSDRRAYVSCTRVQRARRVRPHDPCPWRRASHQCRISTNSGARQRMQLYRCDCPRGDSDVDCTAAVRNRHASRARHHFDHPESLQRIDAHPVRTHTTSRRSLRGLLCRWSNAPSDRRSGEKCRNRGAELGWRGS